MIQGRQATDIEVEMVTTMLRIAADTDRLEELEETSPAPHFALRAGRPLVESAELLRAKAEQTADLKQCPVLQQLVEEDRQRRSR
ncbi:hypothetical protein [Streptomyces sp. NPDC053427]|uniref:hypothetical protein n=1 Tax=Streptomyces sp. NPDC053427 TaxID=3365701 RepID=UPI0037D3D29D